MIINGYSLECLTCPPEGGTQSRSLRGEEPFWSFAISPVLLAPKRRIISGSNMSILNLFLLDQFLDIVDVKAVLDLPLLLHYWKLQFFVHTDAEHVFYENVVTNQVSQKLLLLFLWHHDVNSTTDSNLNTKTGCHTPSMHAGDSNALKMAEIMKVTYFH